MSTIVTTMDAGNYQDVDHDAALPCDSNHNSGTDWQGHDFSKITTRQSKKQFFALSNAEKWKCLQAARQLHSNLKNDRNQIGRRKYMVKNRRLTAQVLHLQQRVHYHRKYAQKCYIAYQIAKHRAGRYHVGLVARDKRIAQLHREVRLAQIQQRQMYLQRYGDAHRTAANPKHVACQTDPIPQRAVSSQTDDQNLDDIDLDIATYLGIPIGLDMDFEDTDI